MTTDNVSRIKERLSISDVVASYIKLDRAGANLKAPCPFHNEKTPSFFVSPDRGTYKCFGCGAGGDIFTFVEQFEGVDFPEALKILADKAGVELQKEDPRLKNERQKLYQIMEEATLFFEKRLSQNEAVKKYLADRGLTDKTISKFRLGFIEDEWRKLSDYLKSKNFSESDLEKVGLIKRTEKGYYDRFRNRVLFPIFDNSGRVVAFSGRIYQDDNFSQAKYLNSPETVLFNKSKVLYGYNFAKGEIRKRDFSILVEGQMDLLMSHQAGFTNTVATSGTALTSEHLNLLRRISNKVVMAFDGDSAGLVAANKSAKLALGMGMEVKLVEIPKGFDPADIIAKNEREWVKLMKNTSHIIEFNLNSILKSDLDKRSLGLQIKKTVLVLIKELQSKIEQDYFINLVSEKTEISPDILWEEMAKIDLPEERSILKEIEITEKEKSKKSKRESLREISGILLWQRGLEEPLINIQKWEDELVDLIGQEVFNKVNNLPDSIKNEIIFEAENKHIDEKNLRDRLRGAYDKLELEILTEEREALGKKIKEGEETDDNLKKYNELSRKIEEKK